MKFAVTCILSSCGGGDMAQPDRPISLPTANPDVPQREWKTGSAPVSSQEPQASPRRKAVGHPSLPESPPWCQSVSPGEPRLSPQGQLECPQDQQDPGLCFCARTLDLNLDWTLLLLLCFEDFLLCFPCTAYWDLL